MKNKQNSVSVIFSKSDNKISTEDEFISAVYSLIPSDLLNKFRESRYTVSVDTHVDPSPIVEIINGSVKQTWQGEYVETFFERVFRSETFLRMENILAQHGWKISHPEITKISGPVVLPKSIKNFVYGDELFPVVPLDSKHFCVADSEERYKQNKKNLGKKWYYYNNSVTYTVNSKNYRCPEFEDIDWKNSVILLGCSIPFGVGLDDRDCLSTKLSELLNLPVINLSTPGASLQFSLDTSVLVKKLYGDVKGVVFVWSQYGRTVLYNEPIVHIGAWNIEKYPSLTDHTHMLTRARLSYETSKFVWGDTPRVDCSYFPDTAEFLDIPVLPKSDLARDLSHPGIESTIASAKLIANLLSKQI